MKKYQVGIEFDPNGNVVTTKGLIGGRETQQVRNKIQLNKKRNTYVHAYFDENNKVVEIWKLNKKEYDKLNCGFGAMWDFGDFLKSSGLI